MTETALIRLDGARRALAEAKTLDEIRHVRDQAEAIRIYTKAAKLGIEMQNDCAEIKLRAERKAGELLAEMPKHLGGPVLSNHSTPPGPRLADLGISRDDSSRWQRVASLPDEVFEQHIAETKAERAELTTAGVLEVARGLAHEQRAAYRAEREAARAAERIPDLPVRLEVGDACALPVGDDTVDLIVTSPPYGLDKPYHGIADPAQGWGAFMGDWLAEAYRVAALGGRLALNVPFDTTKPFPRATYPQAVLAAQDAGWLYRWLIAWNEDNITKSTARGSVDSPSAPHVISRVEAVAVFYKGDWPRASTQEPDLTHDEWLSWTNGLWTFPGESRPWEGHAAAYPEELPRRLIKLLSYPGDTVLDPFVGSGTTALVAWKLGRQCIGFDLVPAYVESARRRLAAGR